MKLTSLDIKGFKSFADRTTIHFNNSITGIVGPNGCGKSNIVDSIRWVLGEQKTSHLRLEKMENLIFNGTKKRKASSLAEVKVTFENTANVLSTDYKTVSVTRRLFRNGESEYLLNDVPCRLKDITNLFLDTGVGKDSYAIIELGMVDEILNDKDHSRRNLFEQAAGISKYKLRKKETLSKLKGTSTDLERVQDLLFEIEGNLKTLDQQAKRAKRYYKLKDDFKEKSIELARVQLQGYKEKYKSLSKTIEAEEDNRNRIDTQIKSLEADLQKLKLASLEKEKSLSELQKEFNEHFNAIKEKENERNLLNEQIKFQEENKKRASDQLEESSGQISEIEETLKSLTEHLDKETKVYSDQKDILHTRQENYNKLQSKHTSLKDLLNEKQREYKELNEKIIALEKKEVLFNVTREKLIQEISETETLLHKRKEEMLELERIMEEKKMEELDAEKTLRVKVAEYEKLKGKIEKINDSGEQLRDQVNSISRQLDSKKNEHNLLKNLVDNLEGFPESIKFLNKQKKWADHPPLLSDIFYCDEKYRIPLEKYLEPYMNHYIVKTFAEAISGAKILSEASKGRAHFFILEAFDNFQAKEANLSSELTSALEVVELDPKFKNLARYLLANVYLVDDKLLNNDGIKNYDGLVILSKSGHLIKNDYSISGGAIGLFEGNRLGRAKNLEKLSKDIRQQESKLQSAEKKLEAQQSDLLDLNRQLKEVNVDHYKQHAQNIQNELEKSTIRFKHTQEACTEYENKVRVLNEKLNGENVEEKNVIEEIRELSLKIQDKKSDLSQEDDSFMKLNDDLSSANRDLNDFKIQLHKLESELNQIRQEIGFHDRQLKTVKEQNARNRKTIADAKQSIDQSKERLAALEDELVNRYEARENYGEKIQKFEQAYYDSRGELNEIEEKIRSEQSKKANAESLLQHAKENLNDLKLQLTSIKERLSISFQVDLNELLDQDSEIESADVDELEEKVAKLKNRLETFGEINPMAIEAFDEMKKRYDFIIEQKQDLESAKKTLEDTIAEIEVTAETQFMDSFNQVKDNFQKVFRTLFTEDDQCDLILLDPSNPLESKIEIIAKPKGKRPTIIDQLSGGEKTLTATALLFSLYLLKPAPFCVFDEVDAPLDDMNIDKFNNIIKQFSKDSQFIIVTHNKNTMTSVDVIYGVTMAEQGISRVVPVDFRNLN